MAFFRTSDNRDDRKVRESARDQRRQQLQAQQQMMATHKARSVEEPTS